MAASDAILFEDMFDVDLYNPDGKLFEKVSRIVCETGSTTEATLTLDAALPKSTSRHHRLLHRRRPSSWGRRRPWRR